MNNIGMSREAYMVFGYACNQKCICCPCEKEQKLTAIIDIEKLKKEVEDMVKIGITDVTISGGEPTIYPKFFEILEYLISNNLKIHILSNGEKFSDMDFAKKFVNLVKDTDITVTTTFHSSIAEEHEYQNGSKGSFDRSLEGLKFLSDNRIQISIKHCVTKYNYKNLKNFIEFVVSNFSPRAEIQIWGIDLCGIDVETANKYFSDFNDIKPYLEDALDYFEKVNIENRNQVLTINNLPLCVCDCYYWDYFSIPDNYHYIDHLNNEININYGSISKNCEKCQFQKYCKGTYLSVFEMYGDDVVKSPNKENCINSYKLSYTKYNDENIKKLYFSIYNKFYLTPRGLTIVNTKTDIDVNIRLKADRIMEILNALSKGIEKSGLKKLLKDFGKNDEIVEDWLVKGIIE